jgi:hypothetical protein
MSLTEGELFFARANRFSAENPIESKRLYGELLSWASAVATNIGSNLKLGDILDKQIRSGIKASRGYVAPEQYVDGLFEKNLRGEVTADIIMARLQLG